MVLKFFEKVVIVDDDLAEDLSPQVAIALKVTCAIFHVYMVNAAVLYLIEHQLQEQLIVAPGELVLTYVVLQLLVVAKYFGQLIVNKLWVRV